MEPLKVVIDELVSAGIRSYVGLLGHGERTRSRRLFKDVLQLSALMSGGPSARISPILVAEPLNTEAADDHPMRSCIILLTLRSILATLLVLRTTALWRRLPELDELHSCCIEAAENVGALPPETPHYAGGRTSGRTVVSLNSRPSHATDTVGGCRRNDAIPTVPELAEPSAGALNPNSKPEQVAAL